MSLAIAYSRAALGIAAPLVTVEVHISNGLPAFTLVGLPETSVKEARERVRSALINSGFEFPDRRITVNLAPADLPKEGGRFDLAIALGILAASQQLPPDLLLPHEFLGELALNGAVRPVLGALPAVLACRDAKRSLLVPSSNGAEAALIHNAEVHCVEHLLAVTGWLLGRGKLPKPEPLSETVLNETVIGDLQEVMGQQQAKRALEIAAAGAHHLLYIGPPGTGKSMLASRLPSILPPMLENEAQESAALHSISGQPFNPATWRQRPFRAPHHSASAVALVGGGSTPRPGEISLAHNGVLFLDELPEFERRVLDNLREPLESGRITISRAAQQVDFPARFQLIGAMNPSPCGHFGDGQERATPDQILRYLNRLSGPFLDRFDLSVEVPPLPAGALSQPLERGEPSVVIRARVVAAQQRMYQRAGKLNSQLGSREIERDCALPSSEAQFLEQAINRLGLSVRAWHRILRVARTIADLSNSPQIEHQHLVETLGYRAMDRLLLRLRG